MMDKSYLITTCNILLIVVSAQLLLCGMGCSLMTVPYVDDFADHARVTTPSVEAAMAASTTPRDAHRSITALTLHPKDGSISHAPLFFEDDHEVAFVEDGSFAWTGDDFVQVFVGSGRFLVSTVFYPVSVFDTSPWSTMVSDGRPSRKVWGVIQDAARQ